MKKKNALVGLLEYLNDLRKLRNTRRVGRNEPSKRETGKKERRVQKMKATCFTYQSRVLDKGIL